MIWRGVPVIILGIIVGACASASPSPDEVKRAWKAALVSPACPEHHMITADRRWLKFIVSGCGSMEQVEMACDEQQCTREVLSASQLDRPRRLTTTDEKKWVDPAHPDLNASPMTPQEMENMQAFVEAAAASVASAGQKKITGTGQRLSDVNAPAYKPTLPKEINQAGIVVWGLYKICVSTEGNVQAVSVIKSALPGGMDGHWIARMETWKYRPLQVDGQPVPFCHPARIEVRSQH